jgi:hypothetical protein
MRNARRVVVFVVGVSALAVWSGSAQAPSLRERARSIASQVARGGATRAQTATQPQSTFDELGVVNDAGEVVVAMAPDDVGDGAIVWLNHTGAAAPKGVLLVSEQDAGQVAVFNTAGAVRFILDGNSGLMSAPGDMAEMFPSSAEAVVPGSVMSIDPDRPGALRVASRPYDRRVAGVVSGARDYRPGITLNAGSTDPGRVTVTLTGTVYCLVTSANGPVRAGDLLTSSAEPGHAMRAGDTDAARGAILGKALEDLRGERGLVLTLAALQ